MKALILPLLLTFTGSLWAQSQEVWLGAGASLISVRSIGSPDPDGSQNDVQLDHGFRIGARYAWNSAGHFGHEIQYAYNRSGLNDATGILLPAGSKDIMGIHQTGYNILYYLNRTNDNARARPFFTAGVHVSDFVLPSEANLQGGSWKWGFNYGVGLKYRISRAFAARFDIRGYDTGKPNWQGALFHQGGGLLQQTEASVGFGFYF